MNREGEIMDKVINSDLNVDIKIKPYVTINGYSLEEFMKKIDQLKNLLEEINQKVDDSNKNYFALFNSKDRISSITVSKNQILLCIHQK